MSLLGSVKYYYITETQPPFQSAAMSFLTIPFFKGKIE